jgi:hypothetical protein
MYMLSFARYISCCYLTNLFLFYELLINALLIIN